MSMQMDAYFKKGQIGTLFVHVGLLHGGSRGGWVGQGGADQMNKMSNSKLCVVANGGSKLPWRQGKLA